MTAVVVVGDLPSTGCVPGTTTIRLTVPSARHGTSKEQFSAAIAELLEREETVLCVYPSWRAKRAHHEVRLTRTLLGSERVVAVPSDLPPLGLALAADLLGYLARYVPPGVLIAMMDRLANQTLAGAWLHSVTKFQHAPTRLSDHIRSYLPGSAFIAGVAPTAAVTRASTTRSVAWRPTDPVHLLVAARGGNDWVRTKLIPTLRPGAVRNLPMQPLAQSYWGGKDPVEFAAFSAHPDALANAARAVRYRPCSWCAELVTTDPCPFCSMSARSAAFRPSHTLPDDQRLATPLVSATPSSE